MTRPSGRRALLAPDRAPPLRHGARCTPFENKNAVRLSGRAALPASAARPAWMGPAALRPRVTPGLPLSARVRPTPPPARGEGPYYSVVLMFTIRSMVSPVNAGSGQI